MIISASRRTDLPTYYSDWFLHRLREGYVCVRNPMNFHQVSQIPLTPDVVDGIVFWTKNPIPMLPKLDQLKDYPYYFQFTLNAYGPDVEAHVPSKSALIIPAFQALSRQIGAERVIWRYDPILLTPRYTVDYHVRYFEEIAKRLSGYTHKCVISFLDLYGSTKRGMSHLALLPLGEEEMAELAARHGRNRGQIPPRNRIVRGKDRPVALRNRARALRRPPPVRAAPRAAAGAGEGSRPAA